jgi:hypothetical protein
VFAAVVHVYLNCPDIVKRSHAHGPSHLSSTAHAALSVVVVARDQDTAVGRDKDSVLVPGTKIRYAFPCQRFNVLEISAWLHIA